MNTATAVKTNLVKRITITFGIVVAILLIPLISMQFTNEVKWDFLDFIAMGTLLLITGLAIEITTRKVKSTNIKVALIVVIVLLLLLIWAELAVGIFGTQFAGS